MGDSNLACMTASFRGGSYEFIEDLVHATGHFGGASWFINAVVTEHGALQRAASSFMPRTDVRNGARSWI
jgi:hypothetical protein